MCVLVGVAPSGDGMLTDTTNSSGKRSCASKNSSSSDGPEWMDQKTGRKKTVDVSFPSQATVIFTIEDKGRGERETMGDHNDDRARYLRHIWPGSLLHSPVSACLPEPPGCCDLSVEYTMAVSALAASSRLLCCLASCSTISASRTRWSCSWPSIFCHFFPSTWAITTNSFEACNQRRRIKQMANWRKARNDDEKFNRVNQSINRPLNQSINQSTIQSINRSIDHSLNQSIDHSINQSIERCNTLSLNTRQKSQKKIDISEKITKPN